MELVGRDLMAADLELLLSSRPVHVAVIDEGMATPALLTQLREASGQTAILVLMGARLTRAAATHLVELGVHTCLPPDVGERELSEAIYLAGSAARPTVLSRSPIDRSREPGWSGLTAREQQVYELSGASDAEIAAILDLSPHTVKTHLKKARSKLGSAEMRDRRGGPRGDPYWGTPGRK